MALGCCLRVVEQMGLGCYRRSCRTGTSGRSAARLDHVTPATGSIKLGSLFLTLPTRALTGQQVISPDGYGARSALSCGTSAASSPSHAGQVRGLRITG